MSTRSVAPLNRRLSRFTALGQTLPHFWLLTAFLGLMLPNWVSAQDFRFTTAAGTITITGRTGTAPTVNIPASIGGLPVTAIADQAFIDDALMTSVTIPNSVATIGIGAFLNCARLIDVMIPNGITTIGDGTFENCFSLTGVTIPNTVTAIGGDAFISCSNLTSVTIPDSVSTIGPRAFYGCSQLTAVTIPNSVAMIGYEVFAECSRLTNVTIPNSVTTIGDGAFSGCSSLTGVTIPNGVTTIEPGAFLSCSSLTAVTIPKSVIAIGSAAFEYCQALRNISVDVANPNYSSLNGVLFDKAQTTLIEFPGGKTGSYTIPNSVITIADAAFFFSSSLTNVTFGNGVTTIGLYVFAGCSNLTDLTIPDTVITIGAGTFSGCTGLKRIYFRGNAPRPPQEDLSIFDGYDGSSTPTIYYLPGTTGWSSFSKLPTAVWSLPNPIILTGQSDFGRQTNGFGFRISWATNVPVVVEATTDLAQAVWSPVSTNTLTDGIASFNDPQWTNHPTRIYRVRSP